MAKRKRREKVYPPLGPIICERCGGPIVAGQQVPASFEVKHYDTPYPHPVLSKPLVIRGIIGANGESRGDMSMGDQLRQRAAMGGPSEREALRRFEELWAEAIAAILVAEYQRRQEEDDGPAPR
jgi:hypothetical protein